MYIIKIYLVIDPGSIHRASEALGTSCVVGVSFVTRNEPFKPYLSFCYWSNSGWGQLATPERLSSPLEAWNFTTPLSLRWREGLEIEFDHMTSDLINHAYEMNETPCINSGHWSFWVGEYIDVLGAWHLNFSERAWKLWIPHPLPVTCSAHVFHLAVFELHLL